MERHLQVDGVTLVRRLVVGLLVVQLVLVALDVTFAYGKIVDLKLIQRLGNLAREDGLGTWFASTQAAAVALTLAGIGLARATMGKPGRFGWGVLAAFFALISVDDALAIHERAGGALRRNVFNDGAEWFPSYSWQLVFGPFLVAMGLFIVGFLWVHLAPQLRRWIAAALALFALAMAFDFVEGIDGAYESIADVVGSTRYTVSHGSKVMEEFMEMAGTTLFLGAFLRQFVSDVGTVEITQSEAA